MVARATAAILLFFLQTLSVLAAGNTLASYGYLGDGNSHQLSTVTSYLGMNTTGWTLAQWQGVLPASTALSDELDWATMQSFINAATGPISVTFPNGSPIGVFNKPISTCGQSVSFFGNGGNINGTASTTLKFTNGTDGIDHCSSPQTTKIELHDIGLLSTTVTGNIFGVNDSNANFTYLNNVKITGFNNCISLNNPNGTRIMTVFCYNGQQPGTTSIGTGINYSGQNSFVNRIENSLMQGYYVSYNFYSTNSSVGPGLQGIEDMQVLNSACSATAQCIVIQAAYSGYGPFNYSFENMSVDAVSRFIYATSCNDILVRGGNWLADAPVGNWQGNLNMIDLGTGSTQCHSFHMRDMWFAPNAAVTMNSLVTGEAGSSDVECTNNHIETNSTTTSSAYLQVAPGATRFIEQGTNWVSSFNPISPPAKAVNYNGNTNPSIRFYSVGISSVTVRSCGTSPSVVPCSNAFEGQILEGGGSPTTCTLNFQLPIRALNPFCILFSTQSQYPVTLSTANKNQLTYTHAGSPLTVNYRCRPY